MKLKDFFSRKKAARAEKKKETFQLDYENLAVPEIHTGKLKSQLRKPKQKDSYTVEYDNLTIPEIHTPGEKKKK